MLKKKFIQKYFWIFDFKFSTNFDYSKIKILSPNRKQFSSPKSQFVLGSLERLADSFSNIIATAQTSRRCSRQDLDLIIKKFALRWRLKIFIFFAPKCPNVVQNSRFSMKLRPKKYVFFTQKNRLRLAEVKTWVDDIDDQRALQNTK